MVITGPDLTKAPPRSPRVRLGGFVILPRLLDKGRATIAAKNGDYVFNCPMDRRFFDFVGTNANTLMSRLGYPAEMAAGAVFLASDEASFVTGTDLLIDGGYTAV